MKTFTRNSFANFPSDKRKEEWFVVKDQLCEYQNSSPSRDCVAMAKMLWRPRFVISSAARNPWFDQKEKSFPRSLTFVRDDNATFGDYYTVSDGRGEATLNLGLRACEAGLGNCTADQPEADQPQFLRLRRGGRRGNRFLIKKFSDLCELCASAVNTSSQKIRNNLNFMGHVTG
jgi:hypothetical protein